MDFKKLLVLEFDRKYSREITETFINSLGFAFKYNDG